MLGSLVFSFAALVSLSYASTCKERLFKDAGPMVETHSGAVVGKYEKIFDTDVAAFLGVPFAAPPTRFAPPQPAPAWPGVLMAQDKPRPCMQYTTRNGTAWFPSSAPSEDCLRLNVWSPASCCCDASRRLPVLVWIYGGAFSAGSSDLDLYDGATIAAFGEAVVVSFNYRVGSFGFLRLGEAQGNVGMHDQLLALRWVRENIRAFGGDPDSITLFGESAGAISISLHLISPLSKGLFHRAILQSGSAYGAPLVDDPQTALAKSRSLAKMAGCVNDTDREALECLRDLDAMELAKVEGVLTSKFPTFLSPVHSSEPFLPSSPKQAYEGGRAAADVDVLVGLNKNEANVFLNYIVPDLFPTDHTPALNLDLARLVVRGLFQGVPDPVLEAVWNAYFASSSASDADSILQAVSDSFGDFVFNCPALFTAEKVGRAYFYWMTHRSLKNPSSAWVGVTHFDDVPFVFGRPIADAVLYTPEDGRFSGDLIQKWVSFAKTGHPLTNNKDDWPVFNATNPMVYDLNPRSQSSVPFPRRHACEFWRAILAASP